MDQLEIQIEVKYTRNEILQEFIPVVFCRGLRGGG